DYIASELSTLGLSVDLAPFSFRGRTYHNVVGAVAGRDARRPSLLIGAHFDSTADTPGADDNASGVAALLECARAIASREPQARVEFVGFDLEELQTVTGRYRVGSRALARAKRARREALGGALILEMVGYRDPRPGTQIVPPFLGIDVPRTGDFLAAVGDTRSRDLLEGFVSAARAAAPALPPFPRRRLAPAAWPSSWWAPACCSPRAARCGSSSSPPRCGATRRWSIASRRRSTSCSSGRTTPNVRGTAPRRSRRTGL